MRSGEHYLLSCLLHSGACSWESPWGCWVFVCECHSEKLVGVVRRDLDGHSCRATQWGWQGTSLGEGKKKKAEPALRTEGDFPRGGEACTIPENVSTDI